MGKLDAIFSPKSIAVLGASTQNGDQSPGYQGAGYQPALCAS